MRALITGYGGFAGGHLAQHLSDTTDWEVWGTTYLPAEQARREGASAHAVRVDLTVAEEVREVIAAARPDVVFHLAAQSFVPEAWRHPWDTIETNVRMQFNVLEAVADLRPEARVMAVTSNEIYGAVDPGALPVDETAPLAPTNPYATSKAAQDLLAGQYPRSHGLHVVRLRPFNHLGPGQDDRFVAASLARQVAEIEAGLREAVVMIGDVTAERDFTDVRDVVWAYRLAAEKADSGAVFNVGSGTSHAIREIVDFMVAAARADVRVEPDPARLRPAETPRTLCNASAAKDSLGWSPSIPFEQTLADVLDDWRARVGQPRP